MLKSSKVSVIIPTLLRQKTLLSTLSNLKEQNHANFEIIVVDQTDVLPTKILEYARKNKIKYLHLTKKSSPYARNVGAKAAGGEILLFLDDDVEIKDPLFIKFHADKFSDKEIGLVGGRVVYNWADESEYKQVGRLKFWGLKEITNFNSTLPGEIDHAPGGNMSVRKNLFDKVGGFSETYKGNAHMEETDFCLRIKKTGCKMVFEPKAVLRHLQVPAGGNRTKDIYEFRYWLVHNFVVFYLKNFPKILFPLCFLREFFWAALSGVKRGDVKMFKIMYKAIIDGIKYHASL